MKIFVVALLVTVLAGVKAGFNDDTEDAKKYRKECIEETKVDPALIDQAEKGIYTEDKNFKCFAKCFYVKAGVFTEEGDVLLEVAKEKLKDKVDKEEMIKLLEKCNKEVKKADDACETAFLLHKCCHEKKEVPEKKEEVKVE